MTDGCGPAAAGSGDEEGVDGDVAACCVPPARAIDPGGAAAVAAVAKALADPVRVQLYVAIVADPGGRVCSCHMPALLGVAQPTLSHHLSRLVAAGLVEREKVGRWAHYTAVDHPLARAVLAAAGG